MSSLVNSIRLFLKIKILTVILSSRKLKRRKYFQIHSMRPAFFWHPNQRHYKKVKLDQCSSRTYLGAHPQESKSGNTKMFPFQRTCYGSEKASCKQGEKYHKLYLNKHLCPRCIRNSFCSVLKGIQPKCNWRCF